MRTATRRTDHGQRDVEGEGKAEAEKMEMKKRVRPSGLGYSTISPATLGGAGEMIFFVPEPPGALPCNKRAASSAMARLGPIEIARSSVDAVRKAEKAVWEDGRSL